MYATKKEVIERIKELAHGDESPTKEEVDLLKTTFYKLHFAEREAAHDPAGSHGHGAAEDTREYA